LTYLSANCSGNKFYGQVVKPYRRLKRVEENLRSRGLARTKRAELEAARGALENHIREAIKTFGRRLPQTSPPTKKSNLNFSKKRPYKSLKLA
jgi:hypothetical protein